MAEEDRSDYAAGAENELTQEIANLKREFANLKSAIAERAQDVVGGVGGIYEGAAAKASQATEALRTQAGVVRENPVTFSSAFLLGGVFGLLVGMAMNHWEPPPRRWYERR